MNDTPLGDDSEDRQPTETRGRKPVPSHVKRKFARRVLRRLAELQMNQQDLADASGITKDAVSTYCRGRSLPTGTRLRQLATALRIDEQDLLPERFPQAEPGAAWAPPAAPASAESILFQMTVYAERPERVRIVMDRIVSPRTAAEIMRLLQEENAKGAPDSGDD